VMRLDGPHPPEALGGFVGDRFSVDL